MTLFSGELLIIPAFPEQKKPFFSFRMTAKSVKLSVISDSSERPLCENFTSKEILRLVSDLKYLITVGYFITISYFVTGGYNRS